jgi:hypothetical protein
LVMLVLLVVVVALVLQLLHPIAALLQLRLH